MTTIRNHSLYNNYCLYTKDVIALMRADSRRNGVPMTNEQHWSKDPSGGYRRVETQKPIWFECLHRLENQMKSLSSYQALISDLTKDPVISAQVDKTIGTLWSRSIVQKDSVINLAALRLAEEKHLRYYEPLVTKTYREIEDFFHSGRIRHEVIVPLNGLDSAIEEVRLGEHVSICRIPGERMLSLLDMNIQLGHTFRNLIHEPTRFAVRITYDSEKYVGRGPDIKYDPAKDDRIRFARMSDQVINVLRIAKAGVFFKLGTFEFQDSLFGMGVSYSVGQLPRFLGPERYRILKKDTVQIRNLWKKLDTKGVKSHRFLENAIHRFGAAMEKTVLEDKLIDLMIAAESLFLNDEKYQGELRYRFSHRIALFHEKKKQQRMRLFNVLKGIYDIRSQILHGTSEKYRFVKKDDNTSYSLGEYCDILTDILRNAIQRMVTISQRKGTPKSIINWDDASF